MKVSPAHPTIPNVKDTRFNLENDLVMIKFHLIFYYKEEKKGNIYTEDSFIYELLINNQISNYKLKKIEALLLQFISEIC